MKKEIIGRGARWLALLALLAVLSVITASGWALGGVFLLFLLPLASWGANAYVRKHIRVSLHVATTTAKNAAVDCTVRVRNQSPFPAPSYDCRVEVINDLTGERETQALTGSVGGKKERIHSFLLQSGYCGRLRVSVKSFTLMDCFGLLPSKAAVQAEAKMTVLPDLFPVDAETAARPAYAEEGSADCRGEDRSEVFQMREYRPGDDVRQIHWKLSSKLDELIYKEASLPESRSVLVFWDKRTRGTPAQMDALAETVSSVSSGLLQSGIQFRLCWTEGDELRFQDISDENALLQAIPALVKNVGSEDCRLPSLKGFNLVFYFGLAPEERLRDDDRVRFVLCGEKEIPGATVFSTKDYPETMRRLEV